MSTAAKDLVLGSVIIVACVVVLAVAFSVPQNTDDNGSAVAQASLNGGSEDSDPTRPSPPMVRPERPVAPQGGDQDADNLILPDQDAATPDRPTPHNNDTNEQTADDEGLIWDEEALAQLDDSLADDTQDRDNDAGRGNSWEDRDQPVRQPEQDDDRRQAPAGDDEDDTRRGSPGKTRTTQERTHVVVRGETYQSISAQYYGTTRQWQRIQEANSIDQRSLLPGMPITIPALEQSDTAGAEAETQQTTTAQRQDRASGPRQYTVQPGDRYYTIARDQLGNARRYKELVELNDIDPYELRAGMTILLPSDDDAAVTARSKPEQPDAPAGALIHEVQRGEILGDISMQYYGTSRRWRAIAEANNITDDRGLKAGQRLIIPDAAERQVDTPNTANTDQRPRTTEADRGPGLWHEIARGDTLQLISRRYYGTTTRHPEILAANSDINPNNLVVGTRVWVPEASDDSEAQPQATPPPVRVEPLDDEDNNDDNDAPDWGSALP